MSLIALSRTNQYKIIICSKFASCPESLIHIHILAADVELIL